MPHDGARPISSCGAETLVARNASACWPHAQSRATSLHQSGSPAILNLPANQDGALHDPEVHRHHQRRW